jgi:hypothetical protein
MNTPLCQTGRAAGNRCLLARLNIPRLTEVRSQQLAAQVSGLEQLARMESRQLMLLQLPAEVINALADWLDVPAQRSGLQHYLPCATRFWRNCHPRRQPPIRCLTAKPLS